MIAKNPNCKNKFLTTVLILVCFFATFCQAEKNISLSGISLVEPATPECKPLLNKISMEGFENKLLDFAKNSGQKLYKADSISAICLQLAKELDVREYLAFSTGRQDTFSVELMQTRKRMISGSRTSQSKEELLIDLLFEHGVFKDLSGNFEVTNSRLKGEIQCITVDSSLAAIVDTRYVRIGRIYLMSKMNLKQLSKNIQNMMDKERLDFSYKTPILSPVLPKEN